jgi:hypothetical protein
VEALARGKAMKPVLIAPHKGWVQNRGSVASSRFSLVMFTGFRR